MNVYENSYLPDVLHGIAENLLIPTMVVIIALILVSLFLIGQCIAERFTERRHYKLNMAEIINQLDAAGYENITDVIVDSKLLRFQKAALLVVSRNMGLGEEALFSLAQLQIGSTEAHYNRRLAWTDVISKIAPMLGLMGTLIPLGPGIVALGQNDVTALSNALLLAFDATVCGLACAITSLIISRIRGAWYAQYINTLESLMSCVIDRAEKARNEGIVLPCEYVGDPIEEFKAFDASQGKRGGLAGIKDLGAALRKKPAEEALDEIAAGLPDAPSGTSTEASADAMVESAVSMPSERIGE